MKTIRQTYHINAPVKEVWKALVNPDYINAWGGGPVKMDEREGSEFSLWGGDIHGKNIEIVPEKKLVQQWFGGNWKKPSIATFALHSEEDGVRIDFLHENVPDEDAKNIEEGWEDYYLGPLKDYLESKS